MDSFIKKIHEAAKKNPKRIVFPESNEDRTLKAIEVIQKEKIAIPICVGKAEEIKKRADDLGLEINWEEIRIEDPGTTEDINHFGTMMVYNDEADGMVSGAISTTADVIRPALQIIKTDEKFHKVSGVYFMVLDDRLLLFADTAVIIEPNSHDLVDITIDTVETAKKFGIEPKVALLSFSTKGATKHPEIDKIREAVAMIKNKRPDIIVDGELQVDAALVKEVAERKCPDSPIQGDANVLIFPNLEAGNIAYKLVERLAKAKAIGPLLQGLKKPVNDISRGCDYKDIINITAFTVFECS